MNTLTRSFLFPGNMACFDTWEGVSSGTAVVVGMASPDQGLGAHFARNLIEACFHHLPRISSFVDLPSFSLSAPPLVRPIDID